MKKLVYLDAPNRFNYDYSVGLFNAGLARAGMPSFRNEPFSFVPLLAKSLAKLHLLRTFFVNSEVAYVSMIWQSHEARLFPICYFSESIPYCYDCWPNAYHQWERFFKRHKIKIAFFSARQSAEYFGGVLPQMESIWLAEGTTPELFLADKPLPARSIDVLELGRKHDRYHDSITAYLQQRGRIHRFEKVPGQVIFPSRTDLIRGLGDSKISILFPSSMTHPARAGNIETLTQKYLESIASGCVLVGHCPDELHDLFGYNPVIEADVNEPGAQLADILLKIDAFQKAVAKNYARLLEIGTWETRIFTMLELLAKRGYEIRGAARRALIETSYDT